MSDDTEGLCPSQTELDPVQVAGGANMKSFGIAAETYPFAKPAVSFCTDPLYFEHLFLEGMYQRLLEKKRVRHCKDKWRQHLKMLDEFGVVVLESRAKLLMTSTYFGVFKTVPGPGQKGA
jgi:hypothetical protein